MTVLSRLACLRRRMAALDLAAWIAPTGDPHLCEYLPEHWAFRRALSGFTGSAGTLVVTADTALLWTDSRYWEQACRELAGTGIVLQRDGLAQTPGVAEYLCSHLAQASRVGLDERTVSADAFSYYQRVLSAAKITLHDTPAMIDAVWPERPEQSLLPVYAFSQAQASRRTKIEQVREALKAAGADAALLCSLDDIAWLTNLRGNDIACTPVFVAYLLLTQNTVHLLIDPRKIAPALLEQLRQDGITCCPYDQLSRTVERECAGLRVLIDEKHVSAALMRCITQAGVDSISGEQPTTKLKSLKTALELESLSQAMLADGVALCELFTELELDRIEGRTVSEWDVVQRLHALRCRCPDFQQESFATIAAVGANAAQPHYTPGEHAHSLLTDGTFLLLDSGGQYLTGTTDITRTVAIGPVCAAMKRDYTAVLQGHIALACQYFPQDVFASQLDTFARAPLWNIGADYGHGTGHGVGFFLSVHEGPVSISPRCPPGPATRVRPGHVLSNEPGLYRQGRWGIRIENLVTALPVTVPDADSEDCAATLQFHTLSLCPIDTHAIDTARLNAQEINWLNTYHRRVYQALLPHLSAAAQRWLTLACEPV